MAEKQLLYSLRFSDTKPASVTARELIQVLTAFNNLSTKAGKAFYGSELRTAVRITHVKPGSTEIQGFIEIFAFLQSTFPAFPTLAMGVKDVPELIKHWFDILKFLKGNAPQSVQTVQNGNAVKIENNSGEVKIINGNVYNTFVFNDVGRDAAKLELPVKHGAKRLDLIKGRRKIGSYSAKDLQTFRSIKPTNDPIESEIDAILEVIAPVFEGDGVWRFKYGRNSLTAKVTDGEYRQKVADGDESFKHGDRLLVRLKTVQERNGEKITTKHYVTKVVDRA